MTKRRVKKDVKWKCIKFVFFLCVFIMMFTLIWLSTSVRDLEYSISELENQKVKLAREGKLILAEKAKSYSVEKIEKFAIKKLGMGFPERERIIYVEKTTGAAPYKVSGKPFVRDE